MAEGYTEKIQKAFKDAGIEADEETCARLSVYMEGILEKNEGINLTAITDPDEFIKEHYVDSASLTKLKEYREAETVCDVGTGAGFPGIVLAALSKDKKFTLIDSLAKRLKVVEELAAKAGIDNIELVHGRAEDKGHDSGLRAKFDLVTARAVARLSVLAELTVPFAKVGGCVVAYKGSAGEEEAEEARRAVNILGVSDISIQDAGVSGTNHVFAVMKKTSKTPGKYPRKAGDPARKPL